MTRGVGLGLGTHAPENLFCSSTWPAVVCEQSPDGGVMLLPLPLQMQSYQELRNRATASRPPTMAGRTRPCGAGQQASSGKRQGQSAEVERGAKKKKFRSSSTRWAACRIRASVSAPRQVPGDAFTHPALHHQRLLSGTWQFSASSSPSSHRQQRGHV